jgi:hypothetical protein
MLIAGVLSQLLCCTWCLYYMCSELLNEVLQQQMLVLDNVSEAFMLHYACNECLLQTFTVEVLTCQEILLLPWALPPAFDSAVVRFLVLSLSIRSVAALSCCT